MRELLRLVLTLAVVGIVSAAVLAGVNNITAPVIAENERQETLQALKDFFPDVSSTEVKEEEDGTYTLVYDGSGKLLGVMATVQFKGYGGWVTYNMAVSSEGKITAIRVLDCSSETPGVGDVIAKPEFLERLMGKGVGDAIQAGVDVDTVSGATISTTAMINSVRLVVDTVAANYLGMEEEGFDIASVPDGTYQGTGQGYKGDIVVEVTVEGGKITDIKVISQEETDTYFATAYAVIPQRIIDEQNLEVDVKTGATGSSAGIVEAVRDALQKALESGGEEE
ncbi:MAG: FMN-binding protein [Dethiobacteria bacterium]